MTGDIKRTEAAFLTVLISSILSGCAAQGIAGFDNRATLGNPDKVLAFVGKKIRVLEFSGPSYEERELGDGMVEITIDMDTEYRARYQILEIVHGNYKSRSVDFVAYDHYGFPGFAKRDLVMLYLTEFDAQLYHVKYQYDEVFPTNQKTYAGCGDPYFFLGDDEQVERLPLKHVTFDPPVTLRISDYLVTNKDYPNMDEKRLEAENSWVKDYFSEPIFKIDGDLATCQMGAYPDELYRIKMETGSLPLHED